MMPRLSVAALREIKFSSGSGDIIAKRGIMATYHSVPFHRVRAVWRDGEPIWSRRLA
jgi:uncharacterized protein (UPF0248 family)